MSFLDCEIKRSYISLGEEGIADSLIKPLLMHAVEYKRSVGFFSSSVLNTILPGVAAFARNGGTIKLITSPRLTEDDVNAISKGYEKREQIIKASFSDEFVEEIQDFEEEELNLLVNLIAERILDIKVVVTKTPGMYHDKLGIMEDADGNKIAFYGSANSSYNGYSSNYEKVRVVKSWVESDLDAIYDEEEEFDRIWDNQNEFLEVYEFDSEAKNLIKEVIEYKKSHGSSTPVKLRDYQEQAIDAWIQNNYHGFFVMATGTGKTWTALFAAKSLLEEHAAMITICAPYKHLVKQWSEDVRCLFPNAKIIMISSENPNWEIELNNEIIRTKYNPDNQVIAISTISSFMGERFKRTIEQSKDQKLLIVDEAHRFKSRDEKLKKQFSYMLGLSATPHNGKSVESGNELMDYFGGKVFDLPIEKAIGKYLVNYYYHPIIVSAKEEEEESFKALTSKIASCFKNGVLINPDGLTKYLRDRLRLISMAEEKIERIDDIIEKIKEKEHCVVYCGDGRLFVDNEQEMRHIEFVRNALDEHGFKASQFTATENMDTRMRLVKAFNKGEISTLVAIRCLDEGINIPSIKSALILSSNDNYREFVQRRGRILRMHKEKINAVIYDVLVLPSTSTSGMALIELRRFYEYARLALNKDELMEILTDQLDHYGLALEDIVMVDDEFNEEALDE